MEKQNWKVGNYQSTVVSDTKITNTNFPVPPNPEESRDEEIEYYGGFLVCESVGNIETAKLIAAAPEMLEVLKQVVKKYENEMTNPFCMDWFKRAKLAIQKATE